jgi:GWxTD domain-containing protein
MRRPLIAALAAMVALTAVGCGSWRRVGSRDRPNPSEALNQLASVPAVYQRLGRLVGTAALPFVGTVAFAAGPGDSVIAVLALSLENRALAFQRDGRSFAARYRVSLSFRREGAPPLDVARDEVVRVATFQETQRSDESVLFQQNLRVTPGQYRVSVTVRDAGSGAESRAAGEFTAPAFGGGTTTAPILAYQATGRGGRNESLALVLNPRGTVAYGSDTLLAYVEGYRLPSPTWVPFEIRDEGGRVVWDDSLRFTGRREVESQVIRISPDSVPLGELELAVGTGDSAHRVSALVSLSTAWVVTNFDEMLALLRYFRGSERLADVRRASAAERPERWREFYRETDPNTATPENEALSEYFSRLAAANQQFTDEEVPGWRTDRGEVFVTLGPPDESIEAPPGTQAGRLVRWTYLNHRLVVYFHDETGVGRLRLTPGSRAEFERVVARVRREEG